MSSTIAGSLEFRQCGTRIKSMALLEQTQRVAIEPSLERTRLGIPGHLAQLALIAGRLAIRVGLLIKPLTTQGYVARLWMGRLLLSWFLSSQFLDLIQYRQNLLEQGRHLGRRSTKSQILLTLLTQVR